MSKENDRYLPHIDGLRAIAVLVVVLFHVHVPGFAGGFIGVDVFLVISGFLITRLILDELAATGGFRFGRFYLRRVRRLGPALLATSTVVLAASAVLQSPGVLERTGMETIAASLSFSNIHFWLNSDYFAVDQWTRPMLHTWSLSLEEQFYLFWPLTLLLAWRARGRRSTLLVVATLAVLSFVLNLVFAAGAPAWLQDWLPEVAQDGKPTLFFMLPFRVFEFAIGGLLAFGGIARGAGTRGGARGDALALLGIAAIVYTSVTYDEQMVFPSWAGLVPCIGTALAIRYGSEGLGARLLGHGPFVWIGQISYSLYLVHWPIIALWYYVAGQPQALGQALVIGASIALAHVSYRYVETPFRRRSLPLWPLAPLLAALLLTAWSTHASGGWPWRFEPVFDTHGVASSAEFHRTEYGGYGYRPGPLGPGANADFLLIGDSHGKQLIEGLLKEVLEPNGLGARVHAGTSCLHVPGIVRLTSGRNWRALRDSALARVKKVLAESQPQPIVLIGESWVTQAGRSARLDADGQPIGGSVSAAEVVEALVRLRDDYGIERLVVVGQVPPPEHPDLFEELSRPPLSRHVDPAQVRSFVVDDETLRWNRELADGARRTGAYEFFDPVEALAKDGRCPAITADDQLVFTDSSHLSRTGSRIVMRHFADRLLRLREQR